MEYGCKKPRGCLMIEHRLIERAIAFMKVERERLIAGGDLDPVTIDTVCVSPAGGARARSSISTSIP